ncbi:uncharacterized protein A1O5_10595 [Cladophialophora psammophila CBS 110553]|uniref:Uncharacterized protein n=1 Tax=Cladophialophora psammophila CBS 110553 TaxID=1182543 RepID=W9WEU7_9EURO|nr:uncharacterized protein A1O5_10595 [Cladophialophora psammophila CBS 110553]EXJ66443.1 hypothetical protein A1O5_10595 [Cladophialophora psammophila CBS 110553]
MGQVPTAAEVERNSTAYDCLCSTLQEGRTRSCAIWHCSTCRAERPTERNHQPHVLRGNWEGIAANRVQR